MQTVRGGGGEAGGASKLLGCGMFVAVWKTITGRDEGGDLSILIMAMLPNMINAMKIMSIVYADCSWRRWRSRRSHKTIGMRNVRGGVENYNWSRWGGDGVIDTKLWLCENYTPGSFALDNSDLVDHTAIIIRYTCFSIFLFVNISAMDADSIMMMLILFDDDVDVVWW